MSGPGDRGRRLAFLAAAAAVLAAALLARLAGAGQVFSHGELIPPDGDSLYHLRRMRQVADAFPAVPWVDAMVAWPRGAPVPWAAGFDVLGALLVLAGRAWGGAVGGDLWVAALCPLLGLAVVAAAMELTSSLLPGSPVRRPAALAAGILAAGVPQGLAISLYGRVDHHVAEALAMLLLARWSLAALPGGAAGGEAGAAPPGRRTLAFEVAGGVVAAFGVVTFTGTPLYVALVAPVLAAAVLTAPRPRVMGSGGPGLLLGAALSALATAPAVAAHGLALAFGYPTWLQPLLLAVAGAVLCGAALAGGRLRPGWPRLLAALGAGAGLAAAAAVASPAGAAQVAAGLREWLLKSDPWLAGIDEFQPLLGYRLGPVGGVTSYLGWLGLALPLLLPLAAAEALRRAGRPRGLALLWLVAALAGLTLLQGRFGRVLAPWLGVVGGLALARAAGGLAGRPRAAAALPLAAALLAVLLDPRVRAALGTAPGGEPSAVVEAALDLRRQPPGAAPGVLAPWDLGNEVLVLGFRPVVSNGFGPYPDPEGYWRSVEAFAAAEPGLLAWLGERRLGWVVAGAANLFGRVRAPGAPIPFSGGGFEPRWLAQVGSAPLLIGGSGVPDLGVRHFERLMPVFASTRAVGGLSAPLPVLWTYQLVEGARVEGRAAPGARVVLEIPLEEHGRPHTWRAFADAGPDGRFTLRVPLPTDLATPTVRTGPGTLRRPGAPPAPLAVPEAAVREGRVVAAGPIPG